MKNKIILVGKDGRPSMKGVYSKMTNKEVSLLVRRRLLSGKEYYNIKRPDGGYVTYKFTCPRCVISKVQVVLAKEQTSAQNITITNNSGTKYTNVIDVNSSGLFELQVTYNNADVAGTFIARSGSFTL